MTHMGTEAIKPSLTQTQTVGHKLKSNDLWRVFFLVLFSLYDGVSKTSAVAQSLNKGKCSVEKDLPLAPRMETIMHVHLK